MEIWKKWSMTAMLSKPASSAVLATAASLLPSWSAESAPLNCGTSTPIAERCNGQRVTPSRLPARLTGFISDATAPSPRDIWAVSQYGGYVLHWNGRRWHVARRWRGGQITDVAAATPKDVWVFG